MSCLVVKDQVDICEIFYFWMNWGIVDQEYNFSILSSEGRIKLSYPLSKTISSHPNFLLASILARKLLDIFKASWFLDLATTNMSNSSPVALAAAMPVS